MPRIVDKLINPLMGLGAEAYVHYKNKSRSPSPNPAQNQPLGEPSGSFSQDLPPDYESDEEAWELNEAADEVVESQSGSSSHAPKANWASPASVEAIVNSFLSQHRPGNQPVGKRLEVPVVLPQRRPHIKMRGFVRAYAPVLEECGITQAAWMDFLEHFHESIKVSPAFDVINVAVNVVGMVGNAFPSVVIQATTTAVTIADMIAKEAYVRNRTNSFLGEMNAQYFRHLGLYCLLMSWKPESSQVVETMDISSTIAKATAASDDAAAEKSFQQKLKSQFKLLKPQDGRSVGDAQMPEAAALIYPELDQASEEQKKGWFSRGKEFAADYMDRRATAQYLAENPDSTLGSVTQAPIFESERGNPNNTPRNAGFKTAITGKESRLGARRRQRMNMIGDMREQRQKNPRPIKGSVNSITKGNAPRDVVKRVLHPDVVYMLVVRMPSEEEIVAARQAMESK